MFQRYTVESEILSMMDDPRLKDIAPYTFGNGKLAVFRKGLTFASMQAQHPTWDAKAAVDGVNRLSEISSCGEKIVCDLDAPDAKLLFLPAKKEKRPGGRQPFVLLCAGGGYAGVCSLVESIPVAARLNDLGLDAFCLNYRSGKPGLLPKPLEDLAAALRLVGSRADAWELDAERYAVCGFSAGGHLVGLWATEEQGYAKYGLPKPECVWLNYPMVSDAIAPRAGKTAELIIRIIMFGLFSRRAERQNWALDQNISPAYPPVYLAMAEDDDTIPQALFQSLITSLEQNNIRHELCIAQHGSHGYGLGRGTDAEGWVEQALAFWRNNE